MDNKQRLKVLKKIKNGILLSRRGTSPAAGAMAVGAILGGVLGFLGEKYLPVKGFLTLFGAASGAILLTSRAKHKNWDAYIFDQLTCYVPSQLDAFSAIKDLAAKETLTYDDLLEWISIEEQAIAPKKPTDAEIARQRFISRNI